MRASTAIGPSSPPPDAGILRAVRRRACLVLGLAAGAVLPAPATAGVTVTNFTVEAASKQAGGHPNVTITQAFSYDNTTDSVKDAFVRLQPGLLGNPQSAAQDSFSDGLLEGPAYTRPERWRGLGVPEVLRSGNHAAIARWRRDRALERTAARRPDLLAALPPDALDAADRAFLAGVSET